MAYIYDEPLNNRSGIGGKEEMQREHVEREMHDQEELHEAAHERKVEAERKADKAQAELEKRMLEVEERA